MAKCPLAELIRNTDQLGDDPLLCRQQCGVLIEEAFRLNNGYYVEDLTDGIELENSTCAHPELYVASESIVRIGESALREAVLHENCSLCHGEVQATSVQFACPFEVE